MAPLTRKNDTTYGLINFTLHPHFPQGKSPQGPIEDLGRQTPMLVARWKS